MLSAIALSLLLAAALWLSGMNEPAVQVGVVSCLAAGCLATISFRPAPRRTSARGAGRWDPRWGIPAVALLAFVLLQLSNPSHVFVRTSGELVSRAHLPWLPHSVSAPATGGALLLLAGGMLLFWLTRLYLVDRRGVVAFLGVQVASGAAMAILVLEQRSGGAGAALYPVTGAFVSPNHYAAYANVLLPISLGLARWFGEEARQRHAGSHPGYLFWLAAGALVASVLATRSRAGILICICLLAAFTSTGWMAMRVSRRLAVVGVFLLAGAGLAAAWVACEPAAAGALWSRLRSVPERVLTDAPQRLAVLGATLRMFSDRWLYGTGAGTFALAFPYYQPVGVAGFYRHAHNEYLQILAEMGVFGSALLGGALWAMWAAPRPGAGAGFSLGRGMREAVGLALAGLAAHALVDFPLRLPALGLLAAALVGCAGGWRRRSARRASGRDDEWQVG